MPTFDIECQFYSPAGLNRGVDPDAIGSGIEWELLEMGGMGQATIPLNYGFDAASLPVQSGDTVKIWAGGETYPRFVGTVSKPDRNLATTETRSLVAFGEMEAMNRKRAEKRILYPGGADLSLFASRLMDVYESKRGVTFGRDFQVAGVSLELLDATDLTLRQAFDQLVAQAPGAAVWGFEVNPATGLVTCYLRPRVTSVGWAFAVGENVQVVTETRESADLCNRMRLKGGDAKFPNILAPAVNDNTSFEKPIVANNSVGNILADPNLDIAPFGVLSFWSLAGSAGVTTSTAHTGKRSVFLFTLADILSQENDSAGATAGDAYRFGAWARLEQTANLVEATGTLTWKDAGGSTVGSAVTLAITPKDEAWAQFWVDTIAPASATGYRVEYQCSAVSGGKSIYLDDLILSDVTQVQQEGWEVFRDGTAVINTLDWAYDKEPAYDGAYSVYVDAVAAGAFNDVSLRPTNNQRVALQGGRQYRSGVWYKSPIGETASPLFVIRLQGKDGNGGDVGLEILITFAGGAFAVTDWTLLSTLVTFDPATVSTEFQIIQRGTGKMLYDAAGMRDGQSGTEWIPGAKYERVFNVQDVVGAGSPVHASQTTYGLQEQVVTNDRILEYDTTTTAWVAAWFEVHAKIARRPRIELTHEPTALVSPGAGTQVRLLGLAEAFGDEWPTRCLYRFAAGSLGVTIEQGDEEPKLARLLSLLSQQAGKTVATPA